MSNQNAERPSELWRWSATTLRDAVRAREVSAAEVAEAHLERCAQVDPAINAMVETSREEALARAAELDARADGARDGLLFGVPTAIKDNTDEAGHVTSNGLVSASDNVAATDASVVAALRASDAVFIGRTNLPSFGLRWFSENELHGRTLNPWTPERTPGGSSGGAAAAVASGIVPIAHANDIGGSIRYPAAMCGVTGIRPTIGRVAKWTSPSPTAPPASLAENLMAVEGPIARTVGDLRLALAAMTTFDPRDSASLPLPYRDEPALPRGAKVGVVRAVPGVETVAANLASVEKAAEALRDAGYEVIDVEVPEILEAHRVWQRLLYEELRPARAEMAEIGGRDLAASMANSFEIVDAVCGGPASLEEFMEGYTRRNQLLSQLEARFLELPLLLTPASAVLAPLHGADCRGVDEARELMEGQWPMTFVPCLGLPGATVPTGVVDGLPGSVQIVGGRYRESWILDAAQAIEDRAGTFTPIDPMGA
ncbi:amidase [Nocardioides sp.]|uniref:amidase n=1 Tax=Nocardioides sp. TaxID=35761 RepID=UPI00351689A2